MYEPPEVYEPPGMASGAGALMLQRNPVFEPPGMVPSSDQAYLQLSGHQAYEITTDDFGGYERPVSLAGRDVNSYKQILYEELDVATGPRRPLPPPPPRFVAHRFSQTRRRLIIAMVAIAVLAAVAIGVGVSLANSPDSNQPGAAESSKKECLPGSEVNGGQCQHCRAGSVGNGTTACMPCSVRGTFVPSGSSGACASFLCADGTTDEDSNAATPCSACSAGTYVPAGSFGACSKFLCSLGTTDDDNDPATPCQETSTTTTTTTITTTTTATTTPTTTVTTTQTTTATTTATRTPATTATTTPTTTATTIPTTTATTTPTTTIKSTVAASTPTTLKPFHMTNCGKEGRNGPSHSQCSSAYANSDPLGYYQSTTNGIQQVKMPTDGRYRIEAVGARGGNAILSDYTSNGGFKGGLGTRVWGEFDLKAGTNLSVVVGQHGNYRPNGGGGAHGGGGGGGTYIWLTDNDQMPLIVAGGGGGASYASYAGLNAQLSESGASASPSGGSGGSNGAGGNGASQDSFGIGGGGGGWKSDGTCPYYSYICGRGKLGDFVGGQQRAGGYLEGGWFII